MSNGASLTIYRRSDAYYLVVSAQTTTGLWQHVPEPPTVLSRKSLAPDLGSLALDCLSEHRPITPHPSRDESVQVRQLSIDPILKSANVRSWRTFITSAVQVDVSRANQSFTITPMMAISKPQGASVPDPSAESELLSPSALDLGRALLQAFASKDASD
ncbi:hypothetical protein [Nocardioides sp. WS12]|uniref:hypothetical protein n=1 Tax=Nocardioides sp. WS12 TaxID=2486272 RepID=UPI0015F8BA64|nr:hypothetical protein [Nocardioides sp. WS12]